MSRKNGLIVDFDVDLVQKREHQKSYQQTIDFFDSQPKVINNDSVDNFLFNYGTISYKKTLIILKSDKLLRNNAINYVSYC